MSYKESTVTASDGTIHYPRHAMLSLCRKILRDFLNQMMEEAENTEDTSWDLADLSSNLREKIDQKAFYEDVYKGRKEFTVKEVKEIGEEKISEEYLLNPRETSQPVTMKAAVKLRKELRGLLQGKNGWKEEDVFLDLLLFLFESHSHGDLFRPV